MISPEPSLQLLPASLADIEVIDRIEQQAFATPWSRDLLRAAIVNRQYEVQVLRDEAWSVLGFYIAHSVHDKSNLDNLAVDAAFRSQGYGRRLLGHWIERAREARLNTLSLQVNTANRAAQRLYERFGFHTIRLLVAYYPNGDDAYQMECRLAAAAAAAPHEAPQPARPWFTRRRRNGNGQRA